MRVLQARNVHEALPLAVDMMERGGVHRESRNGPVLQLPEPVTTVYERPCERVIFWDQRDANPAFHLYESLWMLRGRNDLSPLLRYVSNFGNFSDDGETLYGAYGYRWRTQPDEDQLVTIAERLRANPDDRRCVLSMWDYDYDLGRDSKDIPCNLTVTFQVNVDGRLDMNVFNRSNDIIWGAYGANAVHFSMLHEYMAIWIGRPVGVYRQISSNWHAYEREDYYKVRGLARYAQGNGFAQPMPIPNPYRGEEVIALPIITPIMGESPNDTIQRFDALATELVLHADTSFALPRQYSGDDEPWFEVAYAVLRSHDIWRRYKGRPEQYELAYNVLRKADQRADWIVAMKEWLQRREAKKIAGEAMRQLREKEAEL